MGICESKRFKIRNDAPGQGSSVLLVADQLGLGRGHVDVLFRIFSKCSKRNILNFIAEEDFVIIHQFQHEWSGRMAFHSCHFPDIVDKADFLHYMITVWNYCTLNPAGLSLVLFQFFNKSKNDDMSGEDIDRMVDAILGHKKEKTAHAAIRHTLIPPGNKDKSLSTNFISEEDFVAVAHNSPQIMFIPFEVQRTLMLHTLGSKVWKPISKARERRFSGQSIYEIVGHNKRKNGVVDGLLHCSHFYQPTSNKIVPVADVEVKLTSTNGHSDGRHVSLEHPTSSDAHARQQSSHKSHAHEDESRSHSIPSHRNASPSSKSTHRRNSHDHAEFASENVSLDPNIGHKKQPTTPSHRRKSHDHTPVDATTN